MYKFLKIFPWICLSSSIFSIFVTLNGYSVTGFVLSCSSATLAVLYFILAYKFKRGDFDE